VRTPRFSILAAIPVVLLSLPAAPARGEEPAEGPSLTVYSSADPAGFDPQQFVAQQRQGYANPAWIQQVPGFGVVKETRQVDLQAGVTELKFTDVAEFIDPTSVSFVDLDPAAGTAVLEQAFQFDLASPDKILERYLGETIGHDSLKDGAVVSSIKGRVLSVTQGTVVLEVEGGGLRFVTSRDPGLRLPALPKGLLTKPTLVWKVSADKAGSRKIRTTYQTAGLTWKADYNLILDATDTKADLGAWVTLLNLSGAGYPNARLKLVAGDVQRIQQRVRHEGFKSRGALAADSGGFQEKAFFEYHLYTLPRRTDVLENTTQQLTLFPTARGATVEKVLVYYGFPEAASWGFLPQPRTDRDIRSQSNPKVDVYVRFKNAKANQLGMPLPRGKVRVYKTDDADGTLEFVGEDLIDHTPKDETVLVKLGQAFDVVGERTQVKFGVAGRTMTETIRVQVRNHKDAPAKVIVKENLFRWLTWQIAETSDPFTKVDARTIHFDLDVPANGEKTVTYTVTYTW
jgi:hypothetical protein